MRDFLIRLIINAAALWVAAALLDGIQLSQDVSSLFLVALIFGLINALVRPIIALLTCPFYVLTLGLFKFVVNSLMLLLAARVAGSYLIVDGFFPALLGSIIISVVTTALSLFLFKEPDHVQQVFE